MRAATRRPRAGSRRRSCVGTTTSRFPTTSATSITRPTAPPKWCGCSSSRADLAERFAASAARLHDRRTRLRLRPELRRSGTALSAMRARERACTSSRSRGTDRARRFRALWRAARTSQSADLSRTRAASIRRCCRGWHRRHLAGGRIRLSVFCGDAADGIGDIVGRAAAADRRLAARRFRARPQSATVARCAVGHACAAVGQRARRVATFTAVGRVRRSAAAGGIHACARSTSDRTSARASPASSSGRRRPRGAEPPARWRDRCRASPGRAARHLAESRQLRSRSTPPRAAHDSARTGMAAHAGLHPTAVAGRPPLARMTRCTGYLCSTHLPVCGRLGTPFAGFEPDRRAAVAGGHD